MVRCKNPIRVADTEYRNNRLIKNNEGLSLVEVIVSLLILMIIVVPILSGFITSSQANRHAKDTIYAGTAADNVMENVKALGLKELAMEFYKNAAPVSTAVPTGSAVPGATSSPAATVSPGASETPVTTVNPENFRLASGENIRVEGDSRSVVQDAVTGELLYIPPKGTDAPYKYWVRNVEQGIELYDIEIEVSPANDKVNEYQFADFGMLNGGSTAVVKPSIGGAAYDNKVISYFRGLNKIVADKKYAKVCSNIDVENKNEALKAEPSYKPYPSPTGNQVPMTNDNVKRRLTKNLKITVDEDSSSGTTVWSVNAVLEYTCNNSDGLFSSDNIPILATPDPDDGDDDSEEDSVPGEIYKKDKKIIRSFRLYDSELKVTDADNDITLIVPYTPLHVYDDGVVDFNDEKGNTIESIDLIKNTVNKNLKVYIVMQGDYGYSQGPLYRVSGNSLEKMFLYSRVSLVHDGEDSLDLNGSNKFFGEAYTDPDVGISEGTDGKTRLFNVTVNVYEAGTDNLVSHVDSTVLGDR